MFLFAKESSGGGLSRRGWVLPVVMFPRLDGEGLGCGDFEHGMED
jgi:hypothetical protein